jgi:hypothetical protein
MKEAHQGGYMDVQEQERPNEADSTIAFLIERIETLEQEIREFRNLATQHWSDEAQRFALIDQFLSPAMDLVGLLAQLNDVAVTQNQGFGELRTSIHRDLRAMQSALHLSLSTAGLETEAHVRGN